MIAPVEVLNQRGCGSVVIPCENPGDRDLSAEQSQARVDTVYRSFYDVVSGVLDAREPGTVVVTVHSFTPVFNGQPREVELGLLYCADSRLVDEMFARAVDVPRRKIARNTPYGPEDGVTHSLRLHALGRGLANVMIEVRNDLLRTGKQIEGIAAEILSLLASALDTIAMKEKTS